MMKMGWNCVISPSHAKLAHHLLSVHKIKLSHCNSLQLQVTTTKSNSIQALFYSVWLTVTKSLILCFNFQIKENQIHSRSSQLDITPGAHALARAISTITRQQIPLKAIKVLNENNNTNFDGL